MISTLRAFASLYRELGPRWTLFRLAYAFRLRTGLIRLQMPVGEWSDYKHLISTNPAGRETRWLSASSRNQQVPWDPQTAIAEADRILNGELKYFSHQFIKTGFPPNWHKDSLSLPTPSSAADITTQHAAEESAPKGYGGLSQTKHWSQISDDHVAARRSWFSLAPPARAGVPKQSPRSGRLLLEDSQRHYDIKYIWEPNRFAFAYTLVRAYAASQDEKYPEAFWTLIEDWARHNPPNTGPNWMDGQEIALRLMAWTFGYHAFLNSSSTTPERKENFILYVAAQAERIYKNIGYAISTRSNHAISEAFGLWMVGLLFPELKNAEKYLSLGKKLLEQEATNQIFPDGGYSMYSLNYHRFILHIYLYAIRLGELNDPSLRGERSSTKQSPTPMLNIQNWRGLLRPFGSRNDETGRGDEYKIKFSDNVYEAVSKSIEYLTCLINPATGQMPVYGSNDGALVLPLNNCDFTDYRSLLQLGWYITKGERLFEPGPWDEDVFWLCGESALIPSPSPEGRRESAESPSPSGRGVRGEGESPTAKYATLAPHAGAGESAKEEIKKLSDLRALGSESFPNGGIYLLRSANSQALIRCTDFTSRPSHADQLHVDLWIHGQEIAIDAGTYLYSGEGHWRNGLAHTSVHNTVTVDNKDQMTMLSRFTWANWSKGKVLKHEKDIWQGEHDGYKPVSHKRTVMSLDGDRWLVVDHLNANRLRHFALHWLLSDCEYGIQERALEDKVFLSYPNSRLLKSILFVQMGMVQGSGKFSILRANPNSTRGWRSRYYGHKEPAISLRLETDSRQATFWSFFGFENDVVEIEGNGLKINSKNIPLVE